MKTKKTMGGARRTMEATPKKPMGTQGKPIATQNKAMEPNPNNDDGTTKKTMGGTIRKPGKTTENQAPASNTRTETKRETMTHHKKTIENNGKPRVTH